MSKRRCEDCEHITSNVNVLPQVPRPRCQGRYCKKYSVALYEGYNGYLRAYQCEVEDEAVKAMEDIRDNVLPSLYKYRKHIIHPDCPLEPIEENDDSK